MVEEGSSSKTIEKNANKINFKVIILIGALSVAIFFYTQYLQNTDIFDPKGKARHARPFKPAILIE